MSSSDVYKKVGTEVDGLLVEHPWLWRVFEDHARHFKTYFCEWKSFQDRLHEIERAGASPLSERHVRRMETERPPCPATWEIDDKTCCQYVTLGIIRDAVSDGQTKPLVRQILQDTIPAKDAYAFVLYLMGDWSIGQEPRHVRYATESIERVLTWVKQDIVTKGAGETGQDEAILPPMPDWVRKRLDTLSGELKQIAEFLWQAFTVVDHVWKLEHRGSDAPLSEREKMRFVDALDVERTRLLDAMTASIEGLPQIGEQAKLSYFDDCRRFCRAVIDSVQEGVLGKGQSGPTWTFDIRRFWDNYGDIQSKRSFIARSSEDHNLEGKQPDWLDGLLEGVTLCAGARPKLDGPDLANETTLIIRIDLKQWRKGGCRSLMQDLLDDDLREGVRIKPKRHGKHQPKELLRSLRKSHQLPHVAKAIALVKGKKGTYKLSIPRDRITYESPKT